MKQIIASVVVVLLAVYTQAQNPHYNSGPCLSSDGRTITAVATGLGTGPITVVVSGQTDCVNPANQRPPSWQDFSLSQNISKSRGGNFHISFSLSSLCNKRWTMETQNLAITIWYNNGASSFGPVAVSSCQ